MAAARVEAGGGSRAARTRGGAHDRVGDAQPRRAPAHGPVETQGRLRRRPRVSTAALVVAFGRQQGLPEAEIEKAGDRHPGRDVGYAALDSALLAKPGAFFPGRAQPGPKGTSKKAFRC